jgi:hypothetical protein
VKKTHSVHLPLEVLERSARLLASVPRALSPDDYYERIAPQLFDLLDDEAGDADDGSGSGSSSSSVDGKGPASVVAGGFSDMARVGAFIIGRIVTAAANKKAAGADAPAQAGWAVFAEPLLALLDPSRSPRKGALTAASRRQQSATNATAAAAAAAAEVEMEVVLVTEDELLIALSRLVKLTSSHPNPALVRQLLTPILLPLWALLCFSRPGARLEHELQQPEQQQQQQQQQQEEQRQAPSPLNHDGAYHHQSSALLHTYFRVAAGADELARIKANLLYEGGSGDGNGGGGGAPTSSPASAETMRREAGGGWVFARGPNGGVEIRLRPAARGAKEEGGGPEDGKGEEVKEDERASRSALFNQLLASSGDLDPAQRESLFIRAV